MTTYHSDDTAPSEQSAGALYVGAKEIMIQEFIDQVLVEDVSEAIAEVGAVLAMGKDKHAAQSWKKETYEHQLEKLEGHLIRTGREDESGRLHLAHAISRAIFALQNELNDGE